MIRRSRYVIQCKIKPHCMVARRRRLFTYTLLLLYSTETTAKTARRATGKELPLDILNPFNLLKKRDSQAPSSLPYTSTAPFTALLFPLYCFECGVKTYTALVKYTKSGVVQKAASFLSQSFPAPNPSKLLHFTLPFSLNNKTTTGKPSSHRHHLFQHGLLVRSYLPIHHFIHLSLPLREKRVFRTRIRKKVRHVVVVRPPVLGLQSLLFTTHEDRSF